MSPPFGSPPGSIAWKRCRDALPDVVTVSGNAEIVRGQQDRHRILCPSPGCLCLALDSAARGPCPCPGSRQRSPAGLARRFRQLRVVLHRRPGRAQSMDSRYERSRTAWRPMGAGRHSADQPRLLLPVARPACRRTLSLVADPSLFPMEGLLGWREGSRAKRSPGSGSLPGSRR
jgi:hypothetical protein